MHAPKIMAPLNVALSHIIVHNKHGSYKQILLKFSQKYMFYIRFMLRYIHFMVREICMYVMCCLLKSPDLLTIILN